MSGGGHLPELVGGVVLAPPLRGHGGHLPELVGGVVHAPHLLGLDQPPVHPCGVRLPELGHGGRGQQCWTDWAWICIAG